MATMTVGNTAIISVTKPRGKNKISSIYTAVARILKPDFGLVDLGTLARLNRSKLTVYEKGRSDALLVTIIRSERSWPPPFVEHDAGQKRAKNSGT